MSDKTRFQVVPMTEAASKQLESFQVSGLEAHLLNSGSVFAEKVGITRDGPIAYEVSGLPTGQKAWVFQRDRMWRLMRQVRADDHEWVGEYPTVHSALQALTNKLA